MNGFNTEVYKVKDGERRKLKPDCAKTYDIDLKSRRAHEKIREMATTVGHAMKEVGEGAKDFGQGVKSVGEAAQTLKDLIEDEPSDPTQRDEQPSDPNQRRRRRIFPHYS